MRAPFRAVTCVALTLAVSACKEEGTIKVHSLKFQGVKAVDEGRLKNALATHQSSKIPWGKKAYFDRTRFDADLKRIQAFYADRGYPDARVTGFDVKLNDKQDSVDISVNIAEGDPIKVADIDFEGFDVIPADQFSTVVNQAPLKVGQPRDRQLVLSTHELVLNALKDRGYPYAKVNTAENDGANGKTAVLTFTAEPGKIAHFGDVNIQGNKSVSNRVIERQLTFKPGDLYRRSIVQDSQRRLYGLELFQFANIESVNPEVQADEVPVRVTVAEGNHHRVNFGVGYGTEEKGRVDAEYHHLNFFGGARTAGAHVRYSGLDRGIRLDFTQPYFFGPHVSLNGEGQHWLTFTPAYESTVTGAKATVTHRWSPNTSVSVSLSSQRTSSSADPTVLADPRNIPFLIALGIDPSTGQQNGTQNTVGGDFQHSTADNLLNAHRGYQLAMHFEQAGPVLPGTFKYTGMSIDGRHYLPIAGERFVLASRLQVGTVRPAGNAQTNIPLSSRFFLGGATSVRGWGRYEISPTSASGVPIGGDSMLAFSEEVRATIQGNLGGVLFLDAGNVWSGWSDITFGGLRYAIGPGLRYQTPVGPIRFDFGYQLNPIPGLLVEGQPQTRRWRIHFSIGQAF